MAGEQLFYNRPLPGARLNVAHPLAKDMVGCWLLNENGGMRAMDLSPYGNHGTLTGFADPPLRPFNGLAFDGSNDYIAIPDDVSLLMTGTITLEIWLNRIAQVNNSYIFAKGQDTVWQLRESPTGKFQCSVNAGGVWSHAITANHDIDNGVWRPYVGVYDGANVKAYIDGVDQGVDDPRTGTIATNTNELWLGWATGSPVGAAYNGLVGLARIWKRSLIAADIRALAISPYHPMGLPLFL